MVFRRTSRAAAARRLPDDPATLAGCLFETLAVENRDDPTAVPFSSKLTVETTPSSGKEAFVIS